MAARWYIHRQAGRDSPQEGPYTASEIRERLRNGSIDPFDRVTREGSNVRLGIMDVDEIFAEGTMMEDPQQVLQAHKASVAHQVNQANQARQAITTVASSQSRDSDPTMPLPAQPDPEPLTLAPQPKHLNLATVASAPAAMDSIIMPSVPDPAPAAAMARAVLAPDPLPVPVPVPIEFPSAVVASVPVQAAALQIPLAVPAPVAPAPMIIPAAIPVAPVAIPVAAPKAAPIKDPAPEAPNAALPSPLSATSAKLEISHDMRPGVYLGGAAADFATKRTQSVRQESTKTRTNEKPQSSAAAALEEYTPAPEYKPRLMDASSADDTRTKTARRKSVGDAKSDSKDNRKFFVIERSGKSRGPLTPDEIVTAWNSGNISRESSVQKGGAKTIIEIEVFVQALNRSKSQGTSTQGNPGLSNPSPGGGTSPFGRAAPTEDLAAAIRYEALRRFGRSAGSSGLWMSLLSGGILIAAIVVTVLVFRGDLTLPGLGGGGGIGDFEWSHGNRHAPTPSVRAYPGNFGGSASETTGGIFPGNGTNDETKSTQHPAFQTAPAVVKPTPQKPRVAVVKPQSPQANPSNLRPSTPKPQAAPPQALQPQPRPIPQAIPVQPARKPPVAAAPARKPQPVIKPPPANANKPIYQAGQMITLSGATFDKGALAACSVKCRMVFKTSSGPINSVFFTGAFADQLKAAGGPVTISGKVNQDASSGGLVLYLQSVK